MDDYKKIELEQATERARDALRRTSFSDSAKAFIAPKARTLYTVRRASEADELRAFDRMVQA